MTSDHSHECRNCRGSIDTCPTPNEECNDHPGDCDDCLAAERIELAPPNHQVLVAMDWRSAGLPIDRVLAFVGDALVAHEVTTTEHWQTGEPIPTHRVTFDANRVRNTEVHGRGYHSGFIVHIEHPKVAK